MKYYVTINNKKYEVIVERAHDGEVERAFDADEGGKRIAAPQRNANMDRSSSAANAAGGEEVKSPMPGTIHDINVREGQRVKKGDILFMLEAMKMENEIMADHDATVIKILVSKGQSVSTGDLLLILK